ncbi:Bug family tripartite tricarboxylate transporter substrate binding protein [Rhodovarius lipocyclicus]|uniref:Bug family tripartite tricarboxylate transporter substrate binding protein n=1 Tax=Rhodovarius lipocyclicus TaxID=268410 RepID=UPI001358B583|nr:tripartite tricarboxylate transporter substrate binding protein [Rhodovarius lipocyclicus]
MLKRRLLLSLPALLPTAALAAFPDRVVTIVNGFAAGGSSDIAARIAAPRISQALGQTVVVENRPGAGGTLALNYIKRLAPDGHTVVIADPSSLVIAPLVNPNVAINPLEDFTPLSIWGTTPMVLVVAPDHPARDVAGLLAWLRANPGRASYASSGIGSTPQLATELFLQKAPAGVPPVTHVTYRGGSQMLEAVMKQETGFGFSVLSSAAGHLRGGTLRALAVSGPRRAASLPGVPTMAEAGFPDFDLITWYMLLGPPGMAPELQQAWSRAMANTLKDAPTAARLTESGLDPAEPSSPADAAAYLRAESARYAAIVAAAGDRLRS